MSLLKACNYIIFIRHICQSEFHHIIITYAITHELVCQQQSILFLIKKTVFCHPISHAISSNNKFQLHMQFHHIINTHGRIGFNTSLYCNEPTASPRYFFKKVNLSTKKLKLK